LAANRTPVETVRALCDDTVLGIELALAEVEFNDGRLVRRLLTGEVRRAVSRTFTQAGYPAAARASKVPSTSATNPPT
jgi:hypothetical protein